MNESRHPIDDMFREGLDQFSADAPMHVWDRIDQKRTPVYKLTNNFKQNRRWYLSVASGLILMSSAAMFFLNGEFSSEKLSLLGDANTETNQGNADAGNTDGNAGAGQANASGNGAEGILTAPASEHAMEGTSSTGSGSPARPQPTATAQGGFGELVTDQPIKAPRINPPVVQGEKQDKPEVVVPYYGVPAEKTATEDKDGNDGGGVYTPGNTAPAQEDKNNEIPPVLAPDPITDNTDNKDNNGANKKTALPVTPSPWSVEFVASYDLVNRTIKHSDANYTNIRNSAEKVNYGFSMQLRGQYRLNNAVSLRAGIAFSRISETLGYNAPSSYQEIENRQVIGYILDPINGPTQITYNVKDTVTKTRFTPVSSGNTYTFIDVPLLVNYTWMTGEKFSFNAGGGPLFNVAFMQRGKIVSPQNNEVVDLNSAGNPFRTYAGVNLMLNLGVSYHINRNFDLVFEPGARLGMGSLTSKGLDMTQRYNTINLFTGVRYKF